MKKGDLIAYKKIAKDSMLIKKEHQQLLGVVLCFTGDREFVEVVFSDGEKRTVLIDMIEVIRPCR